jgi:hypothetical protein
MEQRPSEKYGMSTRILELALLTIMLIAFALAFAHFVSG